MTHTASPGLSARLMVGLEIHVELATRSKMFTSAPNLAHRDHYDAEPNTLTDPVVLGMPGVLPTINREAVDMAMLVGLALGCRIAKRTKWDRKSYYYPDLPKNYQISQYDMPLCEEGELEIVTSDQPDAPTKTIRIIRAHLEEDAGKLLHEAPAPGSDPSNLSAAGGNASRAISGGGSIVDLNRAGTPLLEIVTYPDFESPEEVVMFAQTLRHICRHLGVSEGIMQKGHMRFEPNINVILEKDGQTYKTPIVEIKNLNSFRALDGAVRYEFQRQIEDWQDTGNVMRSGAKSTRGWDDVQQVTVLQREKEEAHDYRYFPDPDLVEVHVDDDWLTRVRGRLVELPLAREKRYTQTLGLNSKNAQALIDEPGVCRFYESVLATGVDAKKAAAMLLNYGAKRANERGVRIDDLAVQPAQIKGIVELLAQDKISSSAADELFNLCCEGANNDQSAEQLAEAHGLLQVSDTAALEGYVDQVLTEPRNARIVEDIKSGKGKAIGALLGQIMKLSKGQANPKLVTELIQKKLR